MYMYIQSTSQTIWIFLEFGRGVYKSNSYLQYLFRITIYFLGTFALGLFQLIRWWQIFSSKFLVSIWFLLWCVDFNIWGEINKGEKKDFNGKVHLFWQFCKHFYDYEDVAWKGYSVLNTCYPVKIKNFKYFYPIQKYFLFAIFRKLINLFFFQIILQIFDWF